jgi:hypothetical protein
MAVDLAGRIGTSAGAEGTLPAQLPAESEYRGYAYTGFAGRR